MMIIRSWGKVIPVVFLLGAILCVGNVSGTTSSVAGRGAVKGLVVSSGSRTPLPGATVITLNESHHAISDKDGRFILRGLPLGSLTLQVSHVGYRTQTQQVVVAQSADTVEITVALEIQPALLKDITVSPGAFSIMGNAPVTSQTLTRGELQTLPQFSEDLFRAVQRLPGLTATDFSARFAVRGGENEEVLITLDGLEIYEPFHIKEVEGGALTIVDASVVQGVDIMTGAFPADYGDRLSAVFELTPRSVPVGQRRLSAGLSFSIARVASEGTFAGGRGGWLFSARRGYVDLILKLANEDDRAKPVYYDMYGRLYYQLDGRHVLSTDVLGAWDDLRYYGQDESDFGDSIRSTYQNLYVWSNLHSQWSRWISSSHIVSAGRVGHRRWGQSYYQNIPGVEFIGHDNRWVEFVGLKSDWECELSDGLLLKTGGEGRWMRSDYDFETRDYNYFWVTHSDTTFAILDDIDTSLVTMAPSGSRLGAYASLRVRPLRSLTAELGGRYDHVNYTGDDVWSPRANLVYQISDATAVRVGWGRFYQSERLDGILVGDGETEFGRAERADHYMVGCEHKFESGLNVRLEAYYKTYKDLRPQGRNTYNPISVFPEAEYDRTLVFRERTYARGIELYAKQDRGGKFSWWGSYAYAKVWDSLREIRFEPSDRGLYADEVLPNPRDQRHTLYLDLIFRPAPAWQFNVAFQYHSGVPYTDAHLASRIRFDGSVVYWVQADKQWSSRRESYKRVDLRINRHFTAWGGRITAYAEVVNLFNTRNVRGYQYDIAWNGSEYVVDREAEHWFGRLPSVGVFYEITL